VTLSSVDLYSFLNPNECVFCHLVETGRGKNEQGAEVFIGPHWLGLSSVLFLSDKTRASVVWNSKMNSEHM
jgi:hypothetical protein